MLTLIDESNQREFAKEILTAIAGFQESITGGVFSILTEHAYIHKGISFSAIDMRSMSPGITAKISIVTPTSASGTYIHWRPSIISTSGDNLTVTFYEDNSTVTAGGTITAHNRHRLSNLTAKTTIKSTAVITSPGTAINVFFIGGGTAVGGNSVGSETSAEHEMILKQGSNYSLVAYNGSTSSNTVLIKMVWYEEDNA